MLFTDAGLGIVPGAATPTGCCAGRCTRCVDPGPAPEHVALPQAERDLRDQVRQSASVLTSLGVARHRPGVREEIAAKLRARPRTLWPAGMPAPALRVLQHADEVEAILAAASVDEPGRRAVRVGGRRAPRGPAPAGDRGAGGPPRRGDRGRPGAGRQPPGLTL